MTVRSIAQAAAGYSEPLPYVDVESISWDGALQRKYIPSTLDTNPRGVEFKPDGTKMYQVGYGSDKVYEYDLSTAWDISTATYSQSFSVATEDTTPVSVRFGNNGTFMYILGSTNNKIFRYYLSTAWDISTAAASGSGFSFASEEIYPQDFFFKSDGTKFWLLGTQNDTVYEYTMTSSWVVHVGASYSGNSFLVNGNPWGLSFKSDGTKMFVGTYTTQIREYALSTAWDITTASYTLYQTIWNSSQWTTSNIGGLYIKSDGLKLYIAEYIQAKVIVEYDLSTAWDASTISWTEPSSNYLDTYVAGKTSNLGSFAFNDDGTKLFVLETPGDVVEFNLSTAYDIDTATYSGVSLAVATSSSGITFKPDGTELWVMNYGVDKMQRYQLSTAWDITTAGGAYGGTSLNTWESSPSNFFWSDDGYTVWVVGSGGGAQIHEFSMTTPWFHGTGFSYVQSFSLASEMSFPRSIIFLNHGKQLLIKDNTSIFDYRLSTAWDISTITYNNKVYQDFTFLEDGFTGYGLLINEDEQKMFIGSTPFSEIFQTTYTLE